MYREHELCNAILAEAEGHCYSRALHDVALGKPRDAVEERRVLDLQRWYRLGVRPCWVEHWPDHGEYLRRRGCELLKRDEG
jgi:hypothetical protein